MPGVGRVTVSLRKSTRGKEADAFMSGSLQEIFQHGVTVLRQDRFGMELHTLHIQMLVAHTHDLTVFGPSGNFQICGACGTLNGQ
jgi:hypothetical protein